MMELVINFSGGKDSSAMLAWLCEQYPHAKKHVVMADTGWEHADAVDWSRAIVARFGLELHVVRNPNKTFLTMVERRGKFPAPAQRQCTSDLKRDPIHTWIRRRWPGSASRQAVPHTVVSCMGLRAEESAARAKRPCLSRNNRISGTGRTVWDWNPILGWTKEQVFSYLADREIPLHPAYRYLNRFSCRVCIYMSNHDLQAVHQNDPEAIDIIQMLEQRTGFSMKPEGTVREILQNQDVTARAALGPKQSKMDRFVGDSSR